MSARRLLFGGVGLLTLALAGLLFIGCQSRDDSDQGDVRAYTSEELVALDAALAAWDLGTDLDAALGNWTLRADLESALGDWDLRSDLEMALATSAARAEFIGLMSSTPGGQAENNDDAAMQCAFDLASADQPPRVSEATLRWLQGQDAVPSEPPPVSEETLRWVEEQRQSEPPPVSEETLRWVEEQRQSEPPPVSEETLRWVEEHEPGDADPPPVSEETLRWVEEQRQSEPPPVSEETLRWVEEQRQSEPPPVSEETLRWVEEHEPGDADPPPVSEETLRWVEEQRQSEPPPVSEETLQWIEEQRARESANPAATQGPSAGSCIVLEMDSSITVTLVLGVFGSAGEAEASGRIPLQQDQRGTWSGMGTLASITTPGPAGATPLSSRAAAHTTGSSVRRSCQLVLPRRTPAPCRSRCIWTRGLSSRTPIPER